MITFLDTPGHAAFSAMRARGAKATDLVILVVAADDGVMEQTVESIKYANEAQDLEDWIPSKHGWYSEVDPRVALNLRQHQTTLTRFRTGHLKPLKIENNFKNLPYLSKIWTVAVPIIVAINKIDKGRHNVEALKYQLGTYGINVEDFGGDTQAVEISALKGLHLDDLVQAVLIQAEIMEVAGDPTGPVEGVVLESTTTPYRGKNATVLVQRGTLSTSKLLVAGQTWTKVGQYAKTLLDENNKPLTKITPGYPVQVFGWKELPAAGEIVLELPSLCGPDETDEVLLQKRVQEVLNCRSQQVELKKQEENAPLIQAQQEEQIKKHRDKIRSKMEGTFVYQRPPNHVGAEIFWMLQTAYGDAVMCRRQVFEWYKSFTEGREEIAEKERSRRPSTSTTPEKVDKVLELVHEDPRITVREVAEEAGISFGSTQSKMKDILGVRRLNPILVPKDLTFDQKNARKETASLNLEATTDDPELLKRIYGFDSETIQQASEWSFKNEPRPKKARKAPSKVKVMLTVFFNYQGIVHRSTITADSYLGVLRLLREAIRQKRPELWRSKSWILHHHNAPAHTALKISKFLQDHSTSVFPQPPYSPDLAPCDFFLFGKLKKKLKCRKFQSIEEIKVESKKAMKAIPKTDYQRCFADWKKRWLKCIAANGDYFEGDNLNLVEQ
ncbi:hypothetical protein LAZ67_3004454 [Cordylochernes scorpioides]|uniref:Tr-type G domain-containing protein n=1 Tax=Cordylochernes scorpioides TaxID=51811 RepID=A0ABY6K9U3_9ARAC|nr:hypothetical protein LAZ67_3004454 [Cordylochernes scorpioides]